MRVELVEKIEDRIRAKYAHLDVEFSKETMEKIIAIVSLSDKEVTWFCKVDYDPEMLRFYVSDVYIPHQEVSAIVTKLTPTDEEKMLDDLITRDLNKWRLWGHSHVNMAVNPSVQDKKELGELMENGNPEYFIGMIVNKSTKVRIDISFRATEEFPAFKLEDVDWVLEDDGLREDIKKELSDKVRIIVPAVPKTTAASGHGHGYGGAYGAGVGTNTVGTHTKKKPQSKAESSKEGATAQQAASSGSRTPTVKSPIR